MRFRITLTVLAGLLTACVEASAPEPTPTAGLEIATIACRYTHTDGFGNRYYEITYTGTVTGSEGVLLHLSSPDYGAGTRYTFDCGQWSSFVWSGNLPGCERKAGQPETTSWRATSDLWIGNRTTNQEARVSHPRVGSLGGLSRSIRCVG